MKQKLKNNYVMQNNYKQQQNYIVKKTEIFCKTGINQVQNHFLAFSLQIQRYNLTLLIMIRWLTTYILIHNISFAVDISLRQQNLFSSDIPHSHQGASFSAKVPGLLSKVKCIACMPRFRHIFCNTKYYFPQMLWTEKKKKLNQVGEIN